MDYVLTQISKCVKKVSTWNPKQEPDAEDFPYVDLSSVDKESKNIALESVELVSPADAPSRARQLIVTGDVLVSTVRPNLNGVALVTKELDGATASTGYCVLRPEPTKLDSRYLFYWVQSPNFVESMMMQATGANYPAVSDRIVKQSEIPLPPLSEQKRIAAILDKADALRRKRQQAIDLADQFLRSVFLDMFGDPATNPKGWQTKPIKDLARVVTGNTPSRQEPENYGSSIEWIKSDNINTPDHYLTEAEEFLSDAGLKKGRSVPRGSVLITCIAGSPQCIGNAAIADREVSFNQQINALVPEGEATTEYLYSVALFGKKLIQSISTNAMKGMVSKGNLEKLLVPAPPLALQEKYSETFKDFLTKRKRQVCSLSQSESLFLSLSQQAFSGQL
ncbi:restriction endonuclease subunit S [Shewanella sp. SM20]|uniref:restriction endonuclease subunit S n=1 Tax=unclassified Shewanella TaxID=196818 RepID=UPI0021D9FB95|nr:MULTISPECIES: restriction endonuclease subunit S [unclassified Shewanella]MCU8045668.1 restriction endonuclease subunit S [Shewanella sp. SM68]MCU8049995.1 restriction endonuclease subunit S [Shewanella sp. SM65]MCU8090178.1 restriction endonuclease subunit S [Shewanella sp. SM20]